jgi:hypothetical protein
MVSRNDVVPSAFSKPLAGFKTTARVLGTVITYRLGLPFLLAMTNVFLTKFNKKKLVVIAKSFISLQRLFFILHFV